MLRSAPVFPPGRGSQGPGLVLETQCNTPRPPAMSASHAVPLGRVSCRPRVKRQATLPRRRGPAQRRRQVEFVVWGAGPRSGPSEAGLPCRAGWMEGGGGVMGLTMGVGCEQPTLMRLRVWTSLRDRYVCGFWLT